ncbi:MAG: hypothetical protein RLY49_166 [Candidatus Parcubacteria bacterium]|jgi:peptidoglycan hydrolase-like protein with peptidoglycan-binding domain
MKKILYITLLFLTPISFVHAYVFTTPFGLGSSGEDIYQLQKILNLNSQTLISNEGIGSKGNESYYFGEKTKDAVIRFQNLYRESILTPNGMTQGTGFVGKSTLSFLNKNFNTDQTTTNVDKIIDNIVTNQILPITNSTTNATNVPEFLVSKTKLKAYSAIYVGSQHKLDKAKFYLGDRELRKECQTEYTCKLYIDEYVKQGTYKLKTDTEKWGSYTITILDPSEKKPNLDIKRVNINKENLIKGSNFSSKMKVYTMFGVFETETKNNSFILEFPKDRTINATTTFTGLFYVENSNGLTSDAEKIQYEI